VPAGLADAVREMADKVALVPALTAEMVKASINHMVDGMGQRESWRYHFMLHQFMHGTDTAQRALADRGRTGSIAAMVRERDRPFAGRRKRRSPGAIFTMRISKVFSPDFASADLGYQRRWPGAGLVPTARAQKR